MVTIPEGETQAEVPLSSGSDAGVTSIAAIGSGFRGDVAPVTVTARTMTLQISEAAVLSASADGLLVSDDPAPSGGITVNLSSSDFAILGNQPAAISIKEGSQTTASFSVTRLAEGTVTVTASTPGYLDATAELGATQTP